MSDAPVRGSAGQTFLIGDTLYLRGLEAGDAKRAAAWRSSPFPIPSVRAEEILKEETPAQAEHDRGRLLACRIADDEPVGVVDYRVWSGRKADLSLSVHPALGPARIATKSELLRIVVPWFAGERNLMTVQARLDADEEPVVATAEGLGMREAFRLREAIWRDGARHDEVGHELLHPAWVARLGDPRPAAVDGDETGDQCSRARPLSRPLLDRAGPRRAIVTGERVYLRAIEVEDWEQIAPWTRQETETFFRTGRWVGSALASRHFIRQMAKADPPSDIEFAVCLREGDELIGEVGIYGIDWVHRTAETGSYLYRAQHRGAGMGTEAKFLLLAYAFDRLGLHAVRSFVWAGNTRSAAALRKQGYRDAGRIAWTNVSAGEFTDAFLFDLLAEEWWSRPHQTADPSATDSPR